jgi:predicted house-cleaning noncanonical NTP pyrophosphatase (MazG superfamily)
MKLETYDEITAYLTKKKRQTHLLLGNGFSMAYNSKIFSYNALHRFIDELDNELLSKLFEIVNTKNFELVMQQLDNFSELIEAFGSDKTLKSKVEKASLKLKESLIDAIEELHPEHVFKIPEEKSASCATFLNKYLENKGNIFTTNYDVLLYWVLMRNKIPNAIDGFGRDRENDDEYVSEDEVEYSELRWGKHKERQTIHYLHGALPLFDTGIEIIKEEYDSTHYIMEKIKDRLEKKEYPVFVTAGTGDQKLSHIMHNRYLTNCYENLSNIEGSLITFGFNFGEYDEHIIEAINIAAKHGKKVKDKLWSVYIGVYSEDDKKHIKRISSKFKCKVNLYDAKTAPIWSQ